MSMMTQIMGRNAHKAQIVQDVAEVFGVRPAQILARMRTASVADARFAVFTILYAQGRSLNEVGKIMGRDHGAVHNGLQKFKIRCATERKYAAKAQALREMGYDC
tara:strand:+ start:2479 stop:2793 length:315 start_codon:yes stop_codon:yes gene_type:complete